MLMQCNLSMLASMQHGDAKKHTKHARHETMQPISMQGTMWVFKHASKHVTSFNHVSSNMQHLINMLQHTRSTCNKQRGGLKHGLGSPY